MYVWFYLTALLRVEFLLKTDSGYPKDTLFSCFFFGFESTQLARWLHQERTQMEVQ